MRSIDVLHLAEQLRAADPGADKVLVPTELAHRLGALSSLWPGDYATSTHQTILATHLDYMITRARQAVTNDVARVMQ